MFKIIVWSTDGLEADRFLDDNLYDLVLKLLIYQEKACAYIHAFELLQNDKQPTYAVWREYTDMLYKLIPVARKMVAMGEDF